jgi:hypothetical protein
MFGQKWGIYLNKNSLQMNKNHITLPQSLPQLPP